MTPPPVDPNQRPEHIRSVIRNGKLDLSRYRFTFEEFSELVASGPFLDVTALVLGVVGDRAIEVLAQSGCFPALLTLDLQGSGAALDAVTSLSRGVGLERLTSIAFGKIIRSNDEGGLGLHDHALLDLARSPKLPSLRTIHVDKEWRTYSEGAREEVLVVAIPRDDGAVVECWVHHTCFP